MCLVFIFLFVCLWLTVFVCVCLGLYVCVSVCACVFLCVCARVSMCAYQSCQCTYVCIEADLLRLILCLKDSVIFINIEPDKQNYGQFYLSYTKMYQDMVEFWPDATKYCYTQMQRFAYEKGQWGLVV